MYDIDLYMCTHTHTHTHTHAHTHTRTHTTHTHTQTRPITIVKETEITRRAKRRDDAYTIIYKYIRKQRNTAPRSTLPRFSSFSMQIYSRRNFPNYIAGGIPLDSCLTVR